MSLTSLAGIQVNKLITLFLLPKKVNIRVINLFTGISAENVIYRRPYKRRVSTRVPRYSTVGVQSMSGIFTVKTIQ